MTAIPATVLSGSLGAGKTTLLNHLLETTERPIAVVVNDVGAVNVDGALVERTLAGRDAGSDLVELSNGCICCGLQGDFSRELTRLAVGHEFDHLVVEASGISELEPVARQFTQPGPVGDRYDLTSLVTVVDTPRFLDTLGGGVIDADQPDADSNDGPRPLSALTIEQVERATTVVANKRDRLDDGDRDEVEQLVRTLQPSADLHWTTFGNVDPDLVLETTPIRREDLTGSAGWERAIANRDDPTTTSDDEAHHAGDSDGDGHRHEGHDYGDHEDHDHGDHDHEDHDHPHPPEVYGVSSFVYIRDRPFHPDRFERWLETCPPAVIRTKGIVWLAGRDRHCLGLSQAGGRTRLDVTGQWVATLPEAHQRAYRTNDPDLHWDETWGDRETKLVCIGRELDEAAITDALDACLVTETEFERDWHPADDAFPARSDDTVVVTTNRRSQSTNGPSGDPAQTD